MAWRAPAFDGSGSLRGAGTQVREGPTPGKPSRLLEEPAEDACH